jgi:hypothetical protein
MLLVVELLALTAVLAVAVVLLEMDQAQQQVHE